MRSFASTLLRACFFVFFFIFSLGLPDPVVAAFFGFGGPKYAITLSAENSGLAGTTITATVTQNGVPASGQNIAFTWKVKGDSQTPQPGPIPTSNAIGQVAYRLENEDSQPKIITVTAILESNPKVTAIVDVRFELSTGFIALSDTRMPWAEAKAWCASKGGRLPLIDGKSALSRVSDTATIDGFGKRDTPWASTGLPGDRYWTGTEDSVYPGYLWVVVDGNGKVYVLSYVQRNDCRVVCVP
jgi:hypothetical protein